MMTEHREKSMVSNHRLLTIDQVTKLQPNENDAPIEIDGPSREGQIRVLPSLGEAYLSYAELWFGTGGVR